MPALKGLVRTAPWLTLIEEDKVVYNTTSKGQSDKVTVISGGGSGHEPTHAGFVADGALDAAVAGTIFASPSTKQIQAALDAVRSPKGTVIVVKNYTGDVIHFGLAAERARAQGDKVAVIVVGDDVSVGKSQGGLVGRRGLAATVLVHKITGSAASNGFDLDTVAAIGQSVIDNAVTIGASLDHCNVPGREFETNLNKDEYEIGMGIHNEPGVKKESPLPSIEKLVDELVPILLAEDDEDRSFVKFSSSDDVILLINNLGGLAQLELQHATEVVSEKLISKYGIIPKRTLAGTFTSALNGQGFSITLVNASSAAKATSTDILKLFDYPTKAPGWNVSAVGKEWDVLSSKGEVPIVPGPKVVKNEKPSGVKTDKDLFSKILLAGIESVVKAEPAITKYDTIAGDGDCGETLVNGGNALKKGLSDGEIRTDDGVNSIVDIADIVEDSMGGTSGGLYCIYLSALASGIRESKEKQLDLKAFAFASKSALDVLYKYTKARKGGRTLIDALEPFVEALSNGSSFEEAVQAAEDGANSTRKLDAKFGRASYVSKEELRSLDDEGGLPDPGAIGLAELLKGFLSAYK